MEGIGHVIREDEKYLVIVGWKRELQTFYGYVFDGLQRESEPLAAFGQSRHEIPTISQLESAVSCFARLEPDIVSALRDDSPLVGETRPA